MKSTERSPECRWWKRRARSCGRGRSARLAAALAIVATGSAFAAAPLSVHLGPDPDPRAGLEIRVDGRPVRPGRLAPEGSESWEIVAYVDAPRLVPGNLQRTMAILADAVPELLALGSVRIVLADPAPYTLLPATRDGVILREALGTVPDAAVACGELSWLQQLAAASPRNEGAPPELEPEPEVTELLQRQDGALSGWLERQPAGRAPRLLLLVRERAPAETPLDGRLAGRLNAHGWTVLELAPGIAGPDATRSRLGRRTGGAACGSRRALRQALAALPDGWRLELTLPDPERPHEISVAAPGSALRRYPWAPAPGAEMDAPPPTSAPRAAIRLLPVAEGPRGLRLEALATWARVHRVVFRIDGEIVGSDGSPPFALSVSPPTGNEAHELEVTAYGASGRLLGTDRRRLEPPLAPRVRITAAERLGSGATAAVRVEATVRPTAGDPLESLVFYWQGKSVARLVDPPFRLLLPLGGAAPGNDFIQAVARFRSGRTTEDVAFPGSAFGSRMDVALCELLVAVGGRSPTASDGLEVRLAGRPHAWRSFAPATDLPLAVGLLVDTSESMEPLTTAARRAAAEFLQATLEPGDRAFLVGFDTRPRLLHPLTDDPAALVRRFGALRSAGSTALYDALLFSLLEFPAGRSRRALLAITDGDNTLSRFPPARVIELARRLGVAISFVALTSNGFLRDRWDDIGLRSVAGRTGGRVHFVRAATDLGPVYESLRQELSRQYRLTLERPHPLTPADLDALEVRLGGRRLPARLLTAARP